MARKADTPTFNMKVVVQETGLKPDTLRAWERRYGTPAPQRTEGGHRLYSQHEIDKLKWLIARQDEGLSISKAVDLWRELESQGEDPFRSRPLPSVSASSLPKLQLAGTELTDLRRAWVSACLNFDEYSAQHVLAQAFAIFPIETICFDLLQQGLAEIGRGWYEDTVSVPQEHFASAMALRQLEALLIAQSFNKGEERLLIGCPPQEEHTFSPLLLTLLFRRRNWEVVYLGANVPLDRLSEAVQEINPRLVILAAQTLYTASTLLAVADLLEQMDIPLAFGGAVFSHIEDLRYRIPGHFLGNELRASVEVVDRIGQSWPARPAVKRASGRYQMALAHYRDNRAAIEAQVRQARPENMLTPGQLDKANADLGNNLVAALTLGSMDLLTVNMAWLQGLLMNHHYRMPAEAMAGYLNAYYEALKSQLNEAGQPLLVWFEKLLRASR